MCTFWDYKYNDKQIWVPPLTSEKEDMADVLIEISENGLIYFVGWGLDRVCRSGNKEYFQSIIIP